MQTVLSDSTLQSYFHATTKKKHTHTHTDVENESYFVPLPTEWCFLQNKQHVSRLVEQTTQGYLLSMCDYYLRPSRGAPAPQRRAGTTKKMAEHLWPSSLPLCCVATASSKLWRVEIKKRHMGGLIKLRHGKGMPDCLVEYLLERRTESHTCDTGLCLQPRANKNPFM
jgi:hypothetical protein